MWDEHPVWSAFRVTAWGINRASYLFGWGDYYNPYPVDAYAAGGTMIDYSEPLVSDAPLEAYQPVDEYVAASTDPGAAPADQTGASDVPPEAMASFDAARAEFKQGHYEQALQAVDQAIGVLPKDAALHEFRSLVLFALGRYRESAAAIHAVLAVGPGWNWTTMIRLYGNSSECTKQLRALEQYLREHPNATDARFLLSYLYITMGHNEAAIKQLKAVVKQEPKDSVAAGLLRMLGGDVPSATETPPTPRAGPKPTEMELLGSWKGTRADGSTFDLTLKKSGEFTWDYTKGSHKQQIQGVFVVDDGILAMEPDSGGVMLADVSKPEDNRFTFRQNGTAGDSIVFEKQ